MVENEALLPVHEIAVHLPVFEGPMDLLLFLIRRNEIDIYDIPIETVTRQYLETLYAMEELNLEVAGEFFVMAATLMYIKSRMLLPKQDRPGEEDEGDEDADPRWELVQQLIEYKRFKEVSLRLDELIREARDLYAREVSGASPLLERPIRPSDRIEIWNTFNSVLRRLAEQWTVGEIHDEPVTVADCMEVILQRTRSEPSFTFSSLIPEKAGFHFLGATFLAILELTRLGEILLSQNAAFTDILIERPSPRAVQDETA